MSEQLEPAIGQRWRRLTAYPNNTHGAGFGEVVEIDLVLEKRVEGVVVRSSDKIRELRTITGISHKGQRRRIFRRELSRSWELL